MTQYDFSPDRLRLYLGIAHAITSNRPADARFVNQITGEGYSTEQAALVSIHTALKAIPGARYGDRLSDLQALHANS